MNKDLNFEYKKHIENEIPDLWNRIEDALPSKNIDNVITIYEDRDSENSKELINSFSTKHNKKYNKKSNKIRLYAGIIAACACCAISIPALLLMSRNLQSDSVVASDESEASEAAATAIAPSEDATYDYDATETYEEAVEAVPSNETNLVASKAENSYEIAEFADEEVCEEAEDSSIDEDCVYTDVDVIVDNIYEDDGRTYARVTIKEDPNDLLGIGSQICIDITSYEKRNGSNHQLLAQEDEVIMTLSVKPKTDAKKDEYVYELLDVIDR